MAELLHPLALIDPAATVGEGVSVGPFALVGPDVVLEAGCEVASHAVVQGRTRIGSHSSIGVGAVIGGSPQMRSQQRGGGLEIGAENRVGEYVTIHVASEEGRCTRLGERNFLMAYVHVGHDCFVGNRNELANGAQLAGHVELGDDVTVGGLVAFHQGVHVGGMAMIGGGAMVSRDIPPFACASGDRARVYGVNSVGMKRAGMAAKERDAIRRAVLAISRAVSREAGLAHAREIMKSEEPSLMMVLEQFVGRSRRGLAPLVGQWSNAAR